MPLLAVGEGEVLRGDQMKPLDLPYWKKEVPSANAGNPGTAATTTTTGTPTPSPTSVSPPAASPVMAVQISRMFAIASTFWPPTQSTATCYVFITEGILQNIVALKWRILSKFECAPWCFCQ